MHKKTYGVPMILIIDNIQRIFDSDKNKNDRFDLNWFSSLTVYLDADLLKVMVVSSEYDVYFSIKSLSNTWFNRVIEYRMPILSQKDKEITDYFLSPECMEVFQYEDPESDVLYASKYFTNQIRFYLPLMKSRRKDKIFKCISHLKSDEVDIIVEQYLTVLMKNLSVNLPNHLKKKEKKLKKILKYCIPLEGSVNHLSTR